MHYREGQKKLMVAMIGAADKLGYTVEEQDTDLTQDSSSQFLWKL